VQALGDTDSGGFTFDHYLPGC